MITVYLSSNNVRIVEGSGTNRVHIKKAYSFQAPEGSLINGIVTNSEALKQSLGAFWLEKRLPKNDVNLVLGSTNLVSKAIEAPLLKKADFRAYLLREFASETKENDQVLGTLEIGKGNVLRTVHTLATLTTRDYLQSMIDFFDSIGIKLGSITSALAATLSVLKRLSTIYNTGIVMIADGNSLLSVLINGGSYVYSSTNRLFSAPGTPEYSREVVSQISNIIQFNQSQHINAPLKNVYFAGMEASDIAACGLAISEINMQLEADTLKSAGFVTIDGMDDSAFGCYMFAAGGILNADNKDGLLPSMKFSSEKEKNRRDFAKRLIPVYCVLGIALITTAVFSVKYYMLKTQYDEVNDFNTNPDVVAKCNEYNVLEATNAVKRNQLDEIETDEKCLESYPKANSALCHAIELCADGMAEVSFSSFDSRTGQLNITTRAPDVEKINQYIAILLKQDIFVDVTYTGYTYNADGNNWSVYVTCTLSEEAGK